MRGSSTNHSLHLRPHASKSFLIRDSHPLQNRNIRAIGRLRQLHQVDVSKTTCCDGAGDVSDPLELHLLPRTPPSLDRGLLESQTFREVTFDGALVSADSNHGARRKGPRRDVHAGHARAAVARMSVMSHLEVGRCARSFDRV